MRTQIKLANISCGETNFCDECTMPRERFAPANHPPVQFTQNALGRCDFYKGPNEVKIRIDVHR